MFQGQNQAQSAFLSIWRTSGLREKILFTIAMIALFRFGAHVPMPGVNHEAISRLFESEVMVCLPNDRPQNCGVS